MGTKTRAPHREVDLGWWVEPNGQRARLTWRSHPGRLYLFHPNGTPEHIVGAVNEQTAHRFVDDLLAKLGDERPTVEALREAAGAEWPF
jgi:hypothetical protein